jgi:hypothetical protein
MESEQNKNNNNNKNEETVKEILKDDNYMKDLLKESSLLVKVANNLPESEEYIFYNNIPVVKEKINKLND